MAGTPTYPECTHIKRGTPVKTVNKDIANALSKDFRVLPIFEKSLMEYNYKNFYSFHKNELLKCRWESYVKNVAERTFAPFQFIDIRDYHFYNSRNRLIPSESINKKTNFRYKLKVGPGVDFYGQIPIPQDLLMKRGTQKPKTKGKKYVKPETKSEEQKIDVKDQEAAVNINTQINSHFI